MRALSKRGALVLALIALLHLHCGTTSSLMGLLGANPNLSSITSLLKSAGGISSILGGKQPYTLLAPTNDALSSMGTDAVTNLLKPENASQLTNLLKQQVIPGNVTEDALKGGTVKNAAGNAVDLAGATLGSAQKTKDDGLVYVVNKLLGK
jgi:uncharacterized surface protein with fasciclin (FAS1) repeats